MDKQIQTQLTEQAIAGDKKAMETLLFQVQDLVFNLSLRMLGTFPDAEDATQDIFLKIITHLSSFQGKSAFSTWVFRIAVNHLIDCKKYRFQQVPLSFQFYGDDIENADLRDIPDLTQEVDKHLLAEELKLSCTNVMLQCLDAESRCVFILGTMFHLDSATAGEILEITPESYRQKLSRSRKKMADFLSAYCGEYGSGKCRCEKRLNYAIQNRRLDPKDLSYTSATSLPQSTLIRFTAAMEEIDDLSAQFAFCKAYEPSQSTSHFLQELLTSPAFQIVKNS